MRVDIIQGKGNKMLRRICHEGEVYVMAPMKGSYKISLYNHSNKQRLAVVTVDGVNVLDGKDGDFKGQGYIVGPWETVEIPGWRRDDGTVAAFLFRPEEKSYASQTGRGTRNVGVIGVAVFDEAPPVRLTTCRCPNPEHHHHHHHYPAWPYVTYTYTTTNATDTIRLGEVTCSTSGGEEQTMGGVYFSSQAAPAAKSRRSSVLRSRSRSSEPKGLMSYDCDTEPSRSEDVGTGYGHEVEFQTTSVTFRRATETPAEVVCLRYATRERLQSWGVPVDRMERPERRPSPQAFPVNQGPSVPPPPGWRG